MYFAYRVLQVQIKRNQKIQYLYAERLVKMAETLMNASCKQGRG